MAFCKNCGKELANGIKFCGNCGTAENSNETNDVKQVLSLGGQVLSLWQCYICSLKKLFKFKGRATRKEFCGFHLFNVVLVLLYCFILPFISVYLLNWFYVYYIILIVFSIYCLVASLASLSLMTRRYHDFNESGWNWFWWGLIPIVGQFMVLHHLFFYDGTHGENDYGQDPKGRN